jgi:hypothetical protein
MRLQRLHRVGSPYDEFVTPTYFGLGAEPLGGARPSVARRLAFVLVVAVEFRRATGAFRSERRAHAESGDPSEHVGEIVIDRVQVLCRRVH